MFGDVVTGKIDVRGIEVPDLLEEPLAGTDVETVESEEETGLAEELAEENV